MCGGTSFEGMLDSLGVGLSPRVRGNRAGDSSQHSAGRSIPACAGEPFTHWRSTGLVKVYPRVCGGTRAAADGTAMRCGLSPRVRGNHGVPSGQEQSRRSIPACAGEPKNLPPQRPGKGVYPRVCGGTSPAAGAGDQSRGLSPRVRGNRPTRAVCHDHPGSIPACAGEPELIVWMDTPQAVYPRVCGGTIINRQVRLRPRGLSPRVRGNHQRTPDCRQERGSIPACAGEPLPPYFRCGGFWVYPRVCGGTSVQVGLYIEAGGLSPRVRGNQRRQDTRAGAAGSIPACAGEPKRVWCP